MIHITRYFPRIIFLMIMVMLLNAGCKSRQKASAVTNANAEKTKMEQEDALRKQKAEEMERRKRETEEADAMKKREAEAKAKDSPAAKLGQYFEAIAHSNNVASANNSISEALTLFSSEDTPVLIVINESNGQKDYDKPTTIKAYLNYLKDQKKNKNAIQDLEFDSSGKIKSVELVKQP
jgi:hypothetical protein